MNRSLLVFACSALALLATGDASAGLPTLSGDLEMLSLTDVTEGANEDNDVARVFLEQEHFEYDPNGDPPTVVDFDSPGNYEIVDDLPLVKPTLPAGFYDIYFIHFDPFDDFVGLPSVDGTLNFGKQRIVAVSAVGSTLDSNEAAGLMDPMVMYPTPGDGGRGLEFDSDFVILASDRHSLRVGLQAVAAGYDQLRVFVVPEPSTLILGAMGVVGLIVPIIRRTRRIT